LKNKKYNKRLYTVKNRINKYSKQNTKSQALGWIKEETSLCQGLYLQASIIYQTRVLN